MRRALVVDATLTSYAFCAFLLQSFDDDDARDAAHDHHASTWWSPHDDRALALEVVAHVALAFCGATLVTTHRCRPLLLVTASVAVVVDAFVCVWHANASDAPRAHSRAVSVFYAALAAVLGLSAAHIVASVRRAR